MSNGRIGSDALDGFLRGDPDALAEILRHCGPRARWTLRHRFAGRLDAEDIEDVLAVALYRLWRSRARYDPARIGLAGWFETIALNVARDVVRSGWQRARRRERPCAGDFPDPDPRVAGVVPAPEAAPDPPLHQRVRDLLHELPETQRRILEADIACWPGVMPSAELAQSLGIAPGSVPVYRRRARDWLRDRLRAEGLIAPVDVREERIPWGGTGDATA